MFQKFFKCLMWWLKINLLYDESRIMTWSMILKYFNHDSWLYNSFALLKGFVEWIMSFLNFLDIMTRFCNMACIIIKNFWPLISPFFSTKTKGRKLLLVRTCKEKQVQSCTWSKCWIAMIEPKNLAMLLCLYVVMKI